MKTKQLVKLMGIVATIFSILAFAMMFVVAVTNGADEPTTYTGMQLAFGTKVANASYGTTTFSELTINFSFGVVLAYFLPLIGGILVLLSTFANSSRLVKFIFGVVAFAASIVALILLLQIMNMSTVTYKGILTGTTNASFKDFYTNFKFGIGTTLAIVFNACAICTSGTFTVLQFLKK